MALFSQRIIWDIPKLFPRAITSPQNDYKFPVSEFLSILKIFYTNKWVSMSYEIIYLGFIYYKEILAY